MSLSAETEDAGETQNADIRLPVETDIVITPDGDVIIADMPQELVAMLARLRPQARVDSKTYENRLD